MKRVIDVFTIDAFSLEGEVQTGNPAGLVLMPNETAGGQDLSFKRLSCAEPLTEAEMRQVAALVGFSETAFVKKMDRADSAFGGADFEVRFFTPNEEVDLCGHATIGLYSGLFQLGEVPPGSYKQKTKAGVLDVKIFEDGRVLMAQASPQMGFTYEPELVASSLGLEVADIASALPCQAVSTGLLDLLIPLRDLKALEAIRPDDEAIARVSREIGVVGYHVFALTNEAGSARCRNFAPLYAIPEEAATGTSNGALAAYLKAHLKEAPSAFCFTQGVEMGRPSQICAEVDGSGGIWVGGRACHLDNRAITLTPQAG